MRDREEKLLEESGALLAARAGLAADDIRAQVAANLTVFLSAFAPMRDWLYPRGAGSELLVQLVSRGAAAMIVSILESPVEPDLAAGDARITPEGNRRGPHPVRKRQSASPVHNVL
jgi:hypothetical protein